jgi:ATP-dependent DNA ligase
VLNLVSLTQAAGFIETMDCLPVSKLPEGPQWTYEIKLDGYRLEMVRSRGKTTLIYSRTPFRTSGSCLDPSASRAPAGSGFPAAIAWSTVSIC